MLISCAMYAEALKPLAFLSLTLQSAEADIVMCIKNTLKSVAAFTLLLQKDPKNWSTVQLVRSRLKDGSGEDTDQKEYQGVVVQNCEASLEQSKGDVLADVQRLDRCMKERLEWSDTEVLRTILVFIDTENWQQKDLLGSDDGLSDIRTAVDKVLSMFLPPLEAKGMCAAVIQNEVENIVEHARRYLSIGTESYRVIWYKLHTCPDSSKWPNILMLCELVFSLPFTTFQIKSYQDQNQDQSTNHPIA